MQIKCEICNDDMFAEGGIKTRSRRGRIIYVCKACSMNIFRDMLSCFMGQFLGLSDQENGDGDA